MGFQNQIIKNKRSLGQNFFINQNLGKQISQIVLNEKPDLIVEIGPGQGFFTEFLYKDNSNLILIEKDNTLARNLVKKYTVITVKNEDFLEYDLDDLKEYEQEKILFFGSLPYNVSKKIISKIVSSKYFNTDSYFIIQKEVAQKYTASSPNSNIISINTQLFAQVKKIFNISPESFKPRPKVDSSFVRFSPKKDLPNIEIADFRKFVQDCFNYPRKTLRNNLKNSSFIESEEVEELLSKRPQHLSLEEYFFLFSNIK